MSGPLDRILRRTGVSDLVAILSERLGASDLQSLLLEVYRRRAAAGSPGELMDRYAKSRFSKPSALPAGRLLQLDSLAVALLPEGFEALDLSPVAPLGATAIVTGTSQNRIVSTVRNSEVAADSTNAMALECAVRRKSLLADDPRSASAVKLAASQRLVRAQQMDGPVSFAHFRLFGMCSAGRDTGSFAFEREALPEHLSFYLRLIDAWDERADRTGSAICGARVSLTPLPGGPSSAEIEEDLIAPLADVHPGVEFRVDPDREQGRGYYDSLCFKIHVDDEAGTSFEVGDGGLTDWTQQLVGSRKERLLISGIGSERLAGLF